MCKPSAAQTLRALRLVAELLDEPVAFASNGRFYFEVDGPWLLSLSPDDADRFRLGAVHGIRERGTMWCRSEDSDRLADLVRSLRAEVATLVA
jgi:hypothetical protein